MKRMKRILSLFLVCCMLLLMFPVFPAVRAEAADAVTYTPKRLEYGLLNLNNYGNSTFYNTYVKTSSDFNAITAFGLDYNTEYVRTSGTYTWYIGIDASGNPTVPVLNSLRRKGDLQINYRTTFYNKFHSSLKNHWLHKKLAYQITYLYQAYDDLFYLNPTNLPTGYYAYGDNEFVPVSPEYDGTWFRMRTFTSGCETCGNCSITNQAIAFADVQAPQLVSVYTTSDVNGQVPDTRFKAGEEVYIHLKYNEYIRFSDDSANHGDVKLNLNLSSTESGQSVNGLNQTATLCGLSGDTLTFKYIVPATLASANTDHFINGISGNQPGLYNSINKFNLTLLGKGNNHIILGDGYAAADMEKLTKSECLITDLSGNPAANLPSGGKTLKSGCYLDNVAPAIKSVSASAVGVTNTYVGPDDTLTFKALFSEVLDLSNVSGVSATLNINKSGSPLTIMADKIETVSSGVNGNNVSQITFKPFKIDSGMTPASTPAYISISSVTFPNGAKDMCGNSYEGVVPLPETHYFLDTVVPTAATHLTADNSKYLPQIVDGSGGKVFFFPFKVSDASTDGTDHISGTNGANGSFVWKDNTGGVYPFEYYVAHGSASLTGSESFSTGKTGEKCPLTQVTTAGDSDDSYLFIRLLDNVNYSLTNTSLIFYPQDIAGNTGSAGFDLNYVADNVGPSFSRIGSSNSYDANAKTGSITANIKISDPSSVDAGKIMYQWTTGAIDESAWTTYSGATSSAGIDISVTLPNLAAGAKHTYNLFVKADDLLGNHSESAAFTFTNDLSYPGYNVTTSEEISADPVFTVSAPKKRTDGVDSTMLVMVKDPLGNGSQYFVRTLNSAYANNQYAGFNGDILAELGWGSWGYSAEFIDTLYNWRYVTLAKNCDYTRHDGTTVPVEYGFKDAKSLYRIYADGDSSNDNVIQRLMAIMGGKYYGNVDIKVITGYGATGRAVKELVSGTTCICDMNVHNQGNFVTEAAYFYDDWSSDKYGYYYDAACTNPVYADTYGNNTINVSLVTGYYVDYIPQNANVSEQNWTLKAAAPSVALTSDGKKAPIGSVFYAVPSSSLAINKVTLTSSADLGYNESWNGPDAGAKFRTSIDGAEFTVDIDNLIVDSWDLADVDFDSSDTYFALYLKNSPDSGATAGTELYRTKLAPAATQKIAIPANIAVYTGQYSVKVSVRSKISGNTATAMYDDIYIDRTSIGEFGLARKETHMASSVFNKTDITWYGYDAISNPSGVYSNLPVLVGNSVEQPVTSMTTMLHFTTANAKVASGGIMYRDLYLKVWNATSGVDASAGKAWASWVPINEVCSNGIPLTFVDGAANVNASSYSGKTVPVICGQENILSYQVVSANGEVSEVRSLPVTVSSEQATLDIGLNPESSPKMLTSTQAFVKTLKSNTYSPLTAYYYDGVNDNAINDTVALTDSGTHWFYTVNAYGNYTFVEKTIDFVDTNKPEIVDAGTSGSTIKLLVYENGPLDGVNLYMRYEDAYDARLGINDYVKLELPDVTNGTYYWNATTASNTGVYKISADHVTTNSGKKALLVVMETAFKYDESNPASTVSHTAYFRATDEAGNSSSDASGDISKDFHCDISGINAEPAITNVSFSSYVGDYGNYSNVTAEFNAPVLLSSPVTDGGSKDYSPKVEKLPIYCDGDYEFHFTDLFGKDYTQKSSVNCIGDYGIHVGFSITEPTNGDVTVSIDAVNPNALSFSAYGGDSNGDLVTSTKVMMAASGDITCWLRKGNNASDVRIAVIHVKNIRKAAPAAKIKWYYAEYASNNLPAGAAQTTGEVTAWLESDEEIRGTDGAATCHTFNVGDKAGTAFTFNYADLAGNTASITATLPIAIVSAEKITDTTPPKYAVDVYGRYGGSYDLKETWYDCSGTANDYSTVGDMVDAVSYTGGYLLSFTSYDQSQTKIIVLKGENANIDNLDFINSTGDAVDGVTVSGREVYVNQNTAFTVAIIDANNNVTPFSFNTKGYVDTEKPTAEISYVKTGFYKTRAYIKLSDNSNVASLVSPAWTAQVNDAGSSYNGQYYMDFVENGSIQILFRDKAGNMNTDTAKVDDLDTSAPVSKVEWWSPYYVYDGTGNTELAPNQKTNKDVKACLSFNKTVTSIKAYAWVNNSTYSEVYPIPVDDSVKDMVTINLDTNQATITFLKNAEHLKVVYTAQNGKSGERTLPSVTVIDKDSPVIGMSTTNDVSTADKLTVTFTVGSEPVYALNCGEAGRLYNKGDTITKTISSRGAYTYRFADEAGNVTSKTVNVQNIDESQPSIMIFGEDGSPTNLPHKFYATMSEAGTISFEGKDYPVAAPIDKNQNGKADLNVDNDQDFDAADISSVLNECNWVELEVDKNGSYRITGTDLAGRKTYTYVTIKCIDKTAPVVTFSSSSALTVRQGTTVSAFNTLLDNGVTVSDNASAAADITVVKTSLTQAQLDAAGNYQVTYTITDEAGNVRTAARNVRVYSKDELIVTLNGIKTDNGDTIVLKTGNITASISNLPGGNEPYTLYLHSGLLTAGQMKNGSSIVTNSFTVPNNGFYTLYIVTQSKQRYITYFYVQQ